MIEFNLVPKNLRNRSRTAINWLRVGTIVAVAVTLVAASGSILNHTSLAIFERELAAMRANIQRVDDLDRQLRDARRQNQQLSGEISRLEALGDKGQTERFLGFLDALSAVATDGILLERFEYARGGSISIAGVAVEPEELSRFFDRIKQIQGVREASLSQMDRPAGEQNALRRFALSLQWQAGG